MKFLAESIESLGSGVGAGLYGGFTSDDLGENRQCATVDPEHE